MSSINFEPITLERIVARGNMNKAFKKVVSNKGGAGVDDMQTIELASYIQMHPYEITKSVLEGNIDRNLLSVCIFQRTMENSVH